MGSSLFPEQKHIIQKVWFNSHRTMMRKLGKKEEEKCLVDVTTGDKTSYGQGKDCKQAEPEVRPA